VMYTRYGTAPGSGGGGFSICFRPDGHQLMIPFCVAASLQAREDFVLGAESMFVLFGHAFGRNDEKGGKGVIGTTLVLKSILHTEHIRRVPVYIRRMSR